MGLRRKIQAGRSGFTLLEMMIVMAIIVILVGIGAGRYDKSIHRARETVLKHDLQVMREAIDNFTLDKQAAPQSLEDLQEAGYLREIPIDPMTSKKDWDPEFDNVVLSPDQVTTGITDVHSHASGTGSDGTPYNTW